MSITTITNLVRGMNRTSKESILFFKYYDITNTEHQLQVWKSLHVHFEKSWPLRNHSAFVFSNFKFCHRDKRLLPSRLSGNKIRSLQNYSPSFEVPMRKYSSKNLTNIPLTVIHFWAPKSSVECLMSVAKWRVIHKIRSKTFASVNFQETSPRCAGPWSKSWRSNCVSTFLGYTVL